MGQQDVNPSRVPIGGVLRAGIDTRAEIHPGQPLHDAVAVVLELIENERVLTRELFERFRERVELAGVYLHHAAIFVVNRAVA